MARGRPDRSVLEERIAHAFAAPDLLDRALTHVSAAMGEAGRSNQRLEFLGDRVLGLAVAELLHAAFPEAAEGELSHRLSELVRRESCAAMAIAWDLGPHLFLGSGEGRTGGRRNAAILADAAEAVIGAVFLDGGYAAAQALVARALGHQVHGTRPPQRDAKTALQEWAQGRGRATPVYAIVERSGPDHAPRFNVVARIAGLADASGTGASRRAAEQDAAQALLLREGVWGEGGHAG